MCGLGKVAGKIIEDKSADLMVDMLPEQRQRRKSFPAAAAGLDP
jgi:hypothetical protein